ncbi:hypothetical protein IWX90DRAFT_108534 [Phyllosticta citrichinensis]|uniref:Uncharacterized protein n=1 Tax=Phyllosticta citrichinensis TaxID=1130410 RepID=A0ABR1Y310_9PEZI
MCRVRPTPEPLQHDMLSMIQGRTQRRFCWKRALLPTQARSLAVRTRLENSDALTFQKLVCQSGSFHPFPSKRRKCVYFGCQASIATLNESQHVFAVYASVVAIAREGMPWFVGWPYSHCLACRDVECEWAGLSGLRLSRVAGADRGREATSPAYKTPSRSANKLIHVSALLSLRSSTLKSRILSLPIHPVPWVFRTAANDAPSPLTLPSEASAGCPPNPT